MSNKSKMKSVPHAGAGSVDRLCALLTAFGLLADHPAVTDDDMKALDGMAFHQARTVLGMTTDQYKSFVAEHMQNLARRLEQIDESKAQDLAPQTETKQESIDEAPGSIILDSSTCEFNL